MTKTEFICVAPTSKEAEEIFLCDMDLLHSCRVAGRKEGKVLLSSISGRCDFWMNESDDKNWKVVR